MSDSPDSEQGIKEALAKYGLPSGGDFPFVAPKGWHPTMRLWPGGDQGFVDAKGRLWKRGRSITPGQPFEWDVQLRDSSHLNVDLEGHISHGTGKKKRGKKARRAEKPAVKRRRGRRNR